MIFNSDDAPILIVLGQSNAHGHGNQLDCDERINVPLNNIWGLSREKNQAYGLKDVTWSRYTSHSMNLGETQDHNRCLATYFSKMWQKDIDGGKELPDLYVIQISIGSQGIAEKEMRNLNMWYPKREKILNPGRLGIANISLYPLAVEILKLSVDNLRKSGKRPVILGVHWNQWETEVLTGEASTENAQRNYDELFAGFRKALDVPCKIYLYKPLSEIYDNPVGVKQITSVFLDYAADKENYRLYDLTESDFYDDSIQTKGIFLNDNVHYSSKSHLWFATQQYKDIFDKPNSAIVSPDSAINSFIVF